MNSKAAEDAALQRLRPFKDACEGREAYGLQWENVIPVPIGPDDSRQVPAGWGESIPLTTLDYA